MDLIINKFLSNDTFYIFLTLTLTMLGGNTVRPLPKVLRYIIEKSFLFKYIVLILVGCRMVYPVTNKKLLKIVVFAFLLLYFLEFLRKYD